MARLQDLTPGEARRFRTGRPCLDLAHTGGDGPYAVFEIIHTPADVSRWLGVIAELDDIRAADADVDACRDLRRAVWNAAHDVIGGRAVAGTDRAVINRAAAEAPPVPVLAGGPTAELVSPPSADQGPS